MATFPGLPPLDFTDQPPDAPDEMTGDNVDPPMDQDAPQWGLYKDGEPVVIAESVTSLDLRTNAEISDYPVEGGGFQSYDKVQLPFEGRIRFTTGGSIADRTDLLDSIEDAKQSLDLYDLVMPEKTFENANVLDYSLSRSNGVAGLLSVDVSVEEVRETVVSAFSNTTQGTTPVQNAKQPTSNDAQADGTVQPGLVTQTQNTALANTYFPGPPDPSPLGAPYLAGH